MIPVNPAYREVLGEKCYPSLLDIPEKVDMVDCFPQGGGHPPLVEDAIAIGARTLWLQLGVINHEAAAKADAAGLRGDGSLREDRVRQIVWWPGLVRGQYRGDFIPPSALPPRPARS